jgi:exonuclease VII large subunit
VLTLGQFDDRLAASEKEMTRAVSEKLRQQQQLFEAASVRLGMLDVMKVLKRGFAIVSQEGGYVTSAASLAPGSEIGIVFHDGRREASVKG